MSNNEVCVIYNPTAGRGRAASRMESLRQFLGAGAEFWPTDGPGRGEELALKAASCGFPTIGAAGGDGTVHEVANGIFRAGRQDVALAIYPIGSANDYSHSLGLPAGWWADPNARIAVRAVDLGVVRSASGRERYFINGLGLGLNGAVNIEARHIRHLQGVALYGCALLKAMWHHYVSPSMTVTLDGVSRQVPTLALTLAVGRREGNFILAPNAVLDDGLFDYLHCGPLSRWELLRYVPRMITGNLPTNHPIVWMGRCREAQVVSEVPLAIHIDGEVFSRPDEDVRSVEVRILPGALRVQALAEHAGGSKR